MTRVEAPSRLHFGLLGLPADGRDRWPGIDGRPGLPVRHFGGVGLMIDRPSLCVRVEPATAWSASGPLHARAQEFAKRFVESLPAEERRPFRVAVESAPPEHTGLGVGTQFGLAIAKAVAIECGHPDWPAADLAARVGRGERSAIGVHGFERGGLIVEADLNEINDELIKYLAKHPDQMHGLAPRSSRSSNSIKSHATLWLRPDTWVTQ